ncbi:Kinesin-like protein, partial [Operophtera brumata]
MVAGKHSLVVAETGIHAQSSRSHCIFTITMLSETDGEIRSSCIRLCDLAGCERARSTHNIGTRMKESRAINSESKLTRLLGSGLSGSRGEAVSMVVTLNPAPQYAQETKHVLSLAAVAQDIQINNTAMFASAYETTQDTTVSNNSTEVVKLRADNELLHFELVQAQHRNKELLAAMEEKLEDSANTMREMVEEAKDMTKQYYESQIDALKSEVSQTSLYIQNTMREMMEEAKDMTKQYYESQIDALKSETAPPAAVTGTPTRFLQTKIAYLMTEIAVLE